MIVGQGMWDDSGSAVIDALARLSRETGWTLTEERRLAFDCFHTQGITRVGDRLFLSSVEITEQPVRRADGSRLPGAGVGHLFELAPDGSLRRRVTLGEGTIYHPGGIDCDADGILWVPVSEYRPDSRAIVYRIDTESMTVAEAFRYPDHLGGIVRDPESGLLHAVTWGSRRLLTFRPDGRLLHQTTNKSHLVDFQGCVTAHDGGVVCTGVAEYQTGAGAVFQLGGAAVVDVQTGHIRLEVPVTAQSPSGRVLTYNAVHLDVGHGSLRMLAADDSGELLTLLTPIR